MKIQAGFYWFKPRRPNYVPEPGWRVVQITNYTPGSCSSFEGEDSYVLHPGVGTEFACLLSEELAQGSELGGRVIREGEEA